MNTIDNNLKDTQDVLFLIINFKISGTLRFLSHSQMLNVFQRAVIRANINPQYSEGFNPRPKISLPLPRPVGIESDDEMLVMSITPDIKIFSEIYINANKEAVHTYAKQYLQYLSEQLPSGCDIKSIDIVPKNPRYQPCSATYIFTVLPEYMEENLKNRINNILASESLIIYRPIDMKGRSRKGREKTSLSEDSAKKIDARDFLISIMTDQNCIIIECKISSAGSIRIPEIMQLLDLDTKMLACPIKRTNVLWQDIWQEK